ncbi:class I SAM-dependent methyltransferase [Lactobacillus sp. DCY120]|uniref:Class I SAM-dependent methyltransferase n=1 Tax=Bombilactobacillus apium TaxID=2675299 RepID=A0A850R0U7_9LACO|nr:class I SAM-dependent methyltransferase [Bombilactobacillus apium]NVY95980.1 class I SAM-dependent methyltransferase [Bombilactobacillus apium]
MAEQYFTAQPNAQHQLREFQFQLLQQDLHFTTDNGVFSKQTIDFGTRVLLEAIGLEPAPTGPLLDLGCGYGPIGLTLASLWPQRQVELVDVNQRALALAQQNAQANQIENVRIYPSDAYQSVQRQDYGAIYTNPPLRAGKKVVTAILTQALQYLRTDGQLWCVIQKKQGAPSYKKMMQVAFGNAQIIKRSKGYYVIKSVKTPD